MEPADKLAAAEGFEAPSMVMDQDELDATVSVNVETVFSEILLVKILGTVFFALAGVFAFLPVLLGGDLGDILVIGPSLGLGTAGIVLGILGFFVRSTRKWMLYLAPGVLIAAVAVRPLTSAIGSLDFVDIAFGLVFAICWFLGVEYLHALTRFIEVGEMAIKRRLTNFNLSGVVKHFLGYGFLMLGIVILVTLGVIGIVPLMASARNTMLVLGGVLTGLGIVGQLYLWKTNDILTGFLFGLGSYSPGIVIVVLAIYLVNDTNLFANSAELNSVYGIAIAAAVLFTLLGMLLTVWHTFAEGISTVVKVEYSREKLQEMLASGQVLDLEEGGAARAGGESP
jgi:hypothetical protein